MKTYYRFIFDTSEILEFDSSIVSLYYAFSRAKEWAKAFNATYEYCGEYTH